jgi:hypothetical protein
VRRPPKSQSLVEQLRKQGRNGKADGHPPSAAVKPAEPAAPKPPPLGSWESPAPLGDEFDAPAFPTERLPGWMGGFIRAEAEATQTPPDLAGMLVLAAAGAALARKFRVQVRPGWIEPTNVFTVTSLAVGERKSQVFSDVMAPVAAFEREEVKRLGPDVAEKASARRALEARMKHLEGKAAKTEDREERETVEVEAKGLARELAATPPSELPQFLCDDVTQEKLPILLAKQGGRMLQAAPEGNLFEMLRGRYSEGAHFDVYLKAHAGDTIRVSRVGRPEDFVEQPALTLALAVQPSVVAGLSGEESFRGKGLLARFLYSLPRSIVGSRRVNPSPVPGSVAREYVAGMTTLWEFPDRRDDAGQPVPTLLKFSDAADALLQKFERWLEPQLADGEELSYLAGWANKLAGAIARLAGILHAAAEINRPRGDEWKRPVAAETVSAAVALGRDYLLPHARAAFGLMGADGRAADARALVRWLAGLSENAENAENAPPLISRRDIHQAAPLKRRFTPVEKLDPILELVVRMGYLRPVDGAGQSGRGHPSPKFWVNPLAGKTVPG